MISDGDTIPVNQIVQDLYIYIYIGQYRIAFLRQVCLMIVRYDHGMSHQKTGVTTIWRICLFGGKQIPG